MDTAQQGDWMHWYLELAGHCISLQLMEILFPITPNAAITVSCKRPLTMAVSVPLTFLLGVIEIDGMPALQIIRDLRSLASFLTPKQDLWKPNLPFLSSDSHVLEISLILCQESSQAIPVTYRAWFLDLIISVLPRWADFQRKLKKKKLISIYLNLGRLRERYLSHSVHYKP